MLTPESVTAKRGAIKNEMLQTRRATDILALQAQLDVLNELFPEPIRSPVEVAIETLLTRMRMDSNCPNGIKDGANRILDLLAEFGQHIIMLTDAELSLVCDAVKCGVSVKAELSIKLKMRG